MNEKVVSYLNLSVMLISIRHLTSEMEIVKTYKKPCRANRQSKTITI